MSDISIPFSKSNSSKDNGNTTYIIRKGEYISIPHELHMLDPAYFPDSTTFIPDRFIVTKENKDNEGKREVRKEVEMGTIRPYGGGSGMCKGRIFAERECLALVAGILRMWEIEPVGGKWEVPEQKKMSAVSAPKRNTRVKIRRRVFEWDVEKGDEE